MMLCGLVGVDGSWQPAQMDSFYTVLSSWGFSGGFSSTFLQDFGPFIKQATTNFIEFLATIVDAPKA
jgi:hypothetical protein